MKLIVGAVGRLKDGPERTLYDRYAERLDGLARSTAIGPLVTIEVPEARATNTEARRADEATRLIGKMPANAVLVALDEGGRNLTSAAFADWLGRQRDLGTQATAFLIGGADGHGAAVAEAATLRLALGAMTLPHGIARIVLAEQLYRAATLLAGHPYHRA